MNKPFAKLKRLRNRLSGVSDQAVEIPFEIECDCGATVQGFRRASWIESECQECSATVFVLPMNVYPSTKFVPSEILGGTFKERLSVVTKEILHRSKHTDNPSEAASKQSSDAADASNTEDAAEAKWKLPKITLPQINFRQLIARTFSPFRLLMMAVIATVGLTAWFMIQQRQTETAQKVWLESTAMIAGKLDQEDLNGLLPDLESALNAGAILGKNDAEYRLLSNLQVETMATDALAPLGLVDVFQAAYDIENHLKPDARDKVNKACAAGWFLFDAVATKVNTERGITWMVDFPATPGLHPVSIILPQLLLVEQLELESDMRLLFVAKLSVQTAPANNEDGQWALQVNPEDFAVLTHAAHCKVVGFDPDEDEGLAKTLQQQTEWVEAGATKLQPPEEPKPDEE
ncbi:MAG: hypothetical protein ABJZ55_09735 [Fuerstiella sp.]